MDNSAKAAEDESERLPMAFWALKSCREVFLSIYGEGLLTAQPGSAAARDFAATEVGPAGEWPAEFNQLPRYLSAKLVRQQADLCAGAALLIEAGEVSEPLHSVLRTGFEFAIRAFWVLDPSVSHRERCARAALAEVVSTEMTRRAASKLPDTPEPRVTRIKFRANAKAQKERLRKLFASVEGAPDGDPLKWTIEGTRYSTWTDAADRWTDAEKTGVSGGAMYDQLSILAHPQGYAATVGLIQDPEDGTRFTRVIDPVRVTKVARLGAQSFYSSVTLLTNYHGFKSKHVAAWEEELGQHFLGSSVHKRSAAEFARTIDQRPSASIMGDPNIAADRRT